MKKILSTWKIAAFIIVISSVAVTSYNHSKYFEISKNIEIFANLYKEINTYYVDDLDPAQLMRSGVDAMLESLDPYTNYISESEIEGYRYITEGKYNGIGAMIHKIENDIVVTDIYENQPAFNAGIRAGDRILSIDGNSTQGKNIGDVYNILKGYPQTEVVIDLISPNKEKKTLTLIRDEVKVPNVPYSGMVSPKIGYIALTTFTRQAGKNVSKALQKLMAESKDMEGVILDLRENGGGLLAEAVNVCNVFIPKGSPVASTRGKVKEWDRNYKTLNQPIDTDLKLVVLINKNSASASEIVSGVIQDLDRGVIMGHLSYGKGLVQNTRDVGYNSKVKLTTAKYYIPSGRCIQAVKYENGKPVHIPESQRTAFKTKNGRKVLDGGGIMPDVKLSESDDLEVIDDLKKNFVIFNYVTDYCVKNSKTPEFETFSYDNVDDFFSYLTKNNFEFNSETKDVLKSVEEKASKEGYLDDIKSQINAINKTINDKRHIELKSHKSTMKNILEKEIANRYFFEKGKIQIMLRNDPEVQEAIKLLLDTNKYNKILK